MATLDEMIKEARETQHLFWTERPGTVLEKKYANRYHELASQIEVLCRMTGRKLSIYDADILVDFLVDYREWVKNCTFCFPGNT
jgi:hypothetical protein